MGTSHYGRTVTINLVEQMWRKLDEEYLRLLAIKDDQQLANLQKYRLRGMAEMIVIFSDSYFETPDAIVKETVERHADPERKTAGLRERIFANPWTLEVGQQVENLITGHVGQIKAIQNNLATVEYRGKQGGYGTCEESELRAIAPNGAIWVTTDKDGKHVETPGRAPSPKRKSTVSAETRAAVEGLAGFAETTDIANIYGLDIATVEEILSKTK